MTPEAVALAALDNLDSKLAQLWHAARDGGGLQYLRSLGRFVMLPETAGDVAGEDPADGDGPTQLEL
jgi:hypothetical protein